MAEAKEQLQSLRVQIDELDSEILGLLAIRFSLADKIGILKEDNGIPVTDSNREAEMIKNWLDISSLGEDFLKKLLELILEESKKRQQEK